MLSIGKLGIGQEMYYLEKVADQQGRAIEPDIDHGMEVGIG